MNLYCPECGNLVHLSSNMVITCDGPTEQFNRYVMKKVNLLGYKCPSCEHESSFFDLLTEGGWVNKKRTELIDKILK